MYKKAVFKKKKKGFLTLSIRKSESRKIESKKLYYRTKSEESK